MRRRLASLLLLLLVAPLAVQAQPSCTYCFEADDVHAGGVYGFAEPIHPARREWQSFADLWRFDDISVDLDGGTFEASMSNGPGPAPPSPGSDRGCSTVGPNDAYSDDPRFYGPGAKATMSGTIARGSLDLTASFAGSDEYLCNDGSVARKAAYTGTFTGKLGRFQYGTSGSSVCRTAEQMIAAREDLAEPLPTYLCWAGTLKITFSSYEQTGRREYWVHEAGDVVEGAANVWVTGRLLPQGAAPPTPPSKPAEPACAVKDARGAFEAVQAVYQDDPIFNDTPGKQLRRVDARHLVAELDMVHGKRTVLTGTRETDHIGITLTGTATGSRDVAAVVRFTLTHPEGSVVVHEVDVGMQPLGGACTGSKPIDILLPATAGIPQGGFDFPGFGEYAITMELAQKGGGAAPGSDVTVSGYVRELRPLRIGFFPAHLEPADATTLDALRSNASRMAEEAERFIPDYYPLAPGELEAWVRPAPLDLTSSAARAQARCDQLAQTGPRHTLAWCLNESTTLDVTLMLRAASFASKLDRAIGILDHHEFDTLGMPDASAYAASTQVMFLRPDRQHKTIAHELAHTLPEYLWSSRQMREACGINYHNNETPHGAGVRVTLGGAPTGERMEDALGLMGPFKRGDFWIEQCTYAHLLDALETRVDPLVLEVRGWVVRDEELRAGGFAPGFLRMDEVDLPPGLPGAYALVFRDASGAELARHGFDASFETSEGMLLHMVDFGFRIEIPARAALLELREGELVLASQTIPSEPPVVQILEPSNDTAIGPGGVTVRWDATGGGNLTSTVLVSADDGETWQPVEIETTERSATIGPEYLRPGTFHLVRVIVSDGVLSGEADASFGRPAPPDEPAGRRLPLPGAAALAVVLASVALFRKTRTLK